MYSILFVLWWVTQPWHRFSLSQGCSDRANQRADWGRERSEACIIHCLHEPNLVVRYMKREIRPVCYLTNTIEAQRNWPLHLSPASFFCIITSGYESGSVQPGSACVWFKTRFWKIETSLQRFSSLNTRGRISCSGDSFFIHSCPEDKYVQQNEKKNPPTLIDFCNRNIFIWFLYNFNNYNLSHIHTSKQLSFLYVHSKQRHDKQHLNFLSSVQISCDAVKWQIQMIGLMTRDEKLETINTHHYGAPLTTQKKIVAMFH